MLRLGCPWDNLANLVRIGTSQEGIECQFHIRNIPEMIDIYQCKAEDVSEVAL